MHVFNKLTACFFNGTCVSSLITKTLWFCFFIQNSDDSWSEEEGEVSDEDRGRRNRQSYCSTLSSEGALSEEENTSEHSTSFNTEGLLSTNSSENLQMELANCAVVSDGLSDKELTVRKMRSQVSTSPERVFQVCK